VAPQPRLTGACSSSFFTQPSNLIVLLGLIGLTLTRTRFARAGWRLAAGSLVLIGLIGFLPLGRALSLPLENRFPPWDTTGATPAGIVVLGGAISADMLATRGAARVPYFPPGRLSPRRQASASGVSAAVWPSSRNLGCCIGCGGPYPW
jgi:hypothetical protein